MSPDRWTGSVNSGTVDNVRIVNGVLAGWGSDGLQLNSGTNHHIAHIHARSNGGWGIIVDENGVVESCTCSANAAGGIGCNGQNSVVRSCAVYGNGAQGIFLVNGGVVENCTAYTNATGIRGDIATAVTACTAKDNTGDGIVVPSARRRQRLLQLQQRRRRHRLELHLHHHHRLHRRAQHRRRHRGPRKLHAAREHLRCQRPGAAIGAGIKVTGPDCRVESNTFMRNDVGIDVQFTGNFIVRNTAAGNTTNYQIVVSNKVGVIVNAPNSLAISGSTGGTGVGSTDPWANFSF